MSAAVVLTFPHDRGAAINCEGMRQFVSAEPLATARLDIRHALLLLDIAVFRLRASVPAQAPELFAKELATIDELLDAARASARQI